jgi:cation diffusion facilitator CzcD-associated flavoprotein CzcO
MEGATMTAETTPRGGWPASGHVRVAVLGAGFGGLAIGHYLRRAGIDDFVIIDRGDTVGGTWRDNTYPGCGCDVASHLYSFSFAPNPEWSRSYSRQPEIHAYLQKVARDQDLERHLALGVEGLDSRWDDATATWTVETSRGTITADIVIGAAGPLSTPVSPSLPGLDSFDGPVFHTAQWRSDVDLRGKRIGVIGTGASAVQLVPEIQPVAGRLTVFQRTPPWVLPKGDRALSAAEHALFRAVPALTKVPRAGNYLLREASVPAFVLQPAMMRIAELASKEMIRRQISDPELRRQVTPHYRLGCKRVLPANEYYPALQQFNVELVPHALTSFEGNTAIAADGSRHELDVVIFGTGFQVSDMPVAHHVFGRGGVRMSDKWAVEGRSALRLTTVAGFPNLFLVLGPSAGLGHSSMVYVIESQARYIASAVKAMTAGRLAAIEPDPVAQSRWNRTIQRRMKRTVWQTGGCVSWYQDPDGNNTTLWPASTLRMRHELQSIDLREYRVRKLDPSVAQARAAASSTPTTGAQA